MIQAKILLFLLFMLPSLSLVAQPENELDSLELAEAFIEDESFQNAIGFYRRFLTMNPDDPELNYKLGFCLLNTPTGKPEAIEYLETALKRYKKKEGKKSVNYIQTYFYLGRAYRATYQFDEAEKHFKYLLKKINNRRFRKEVELEMKYCKDGRELYNDSLNVELENLGSPINTPFSDHSPVYTADEKIMIFTSRRENDTGGVPDMTGSYDENIFITRNIDGKWTEPEGISKNINTAEHEASIGLSLDGDILLLYRSNDEGSIYLSHREGDDWSKPQKLGPTINTKSRETHASLSADGRYLYFTSDRKGGFGGLDIYVSEIEEDGTWSEAKNLGPAVNTELDEEGAYIHPDGKTLYFSSEGHKNMGGFDVFKVEKNEFGTWTLPENLGYPINTVEDDIFYVPAPEGKRVYLSSFRPGGIGDNDIYIINKKEEKTEQISVLIGKVYNKCNDKLARADITMIDMTNGKESYYSPNKYTGSFVIVAKKEKPYNLLAAVDDKIIFNDTINLQSDFPYKYPLDSIRLDPFTKCEDEITEEDSVYIAERTDSEGNLYDETITIGNVLFGYNADDYKATPDVDSLTRFLQENPNTVIRIKAFADARGRAVSNYYLSVRRGNAVKEYFKRQGIKDSQLEVKGYGEENPIALNYKAGRYNLQGQKYNRRVEFEVIRQGEKSLLLKYKPQIPEKHQNSDYKQDYKKESGYPETRK